MNSFFITAKSKMTTLRHRFWAFRAALRVANQEYNRNVTTLKTIEERLHDR